MQTDKGTVLRQIAALIFFLLVATGAQAEDKKTDPWQPLRFIIGSWQGTVSGQSGSGTVSRSYEFILNDKP